MRFSLVRFGEVWFGLFGEVWLAVVSWLAGRGPVVGKWGGWWVNGVEEVMGVEGK